MGEPAREAKVSAIVHARNAAATLDRALASLAWADERLVVDMESEDATAAIAVRHGARVLSTPLASRVDGVRNDFLDRVAHDWIFVLDADEALGEDAGETVHQLLDSFGDHYDAFAIPRTDLICGQVMRGSGWSPDLQVRLFRRGTVRWEDGVHRPPVVVPGRHRLRELGPEDGLRIHHRNYEDLRHFLRKQFEYALADRYDSNPESFEFSDYIARAYEILALREEQEMDGDLSHALALALAWNEIVRGLLHWDSFRPRPELGYLAALPVATSRVPWWRIQVRRWLGRRQPIAYYVRRLNDLLGRWLDRAD